MMNIGIMMLFASMLTSILTRSFSHQNLIYGSELFFVLWSIRYALTKKSVMYGYASCKNVKIELRERILRKMNRLGFQYDSKT